MPPVLLVDGLSTDAQFGRDLLPRPALDAGASDLYGFELLQQPPQGGDGPQPDARVAVAGTDEVTAATMRLRPHAWWQVSAAELTHHHLRAREQQFRMW
jgi:hypothetical protein